MLKAGFGSIVVLAACGALAGCGGSGSSGGGTPGYADLIGEGDALFDEALTMDITDADSLPTSGSAQYDGVMAVEVYADDDDAGGLESSIFLAGDLAMNVDFGAVDPISGSVTNIADSDEARYGGSLSLGASTLNRVADPEDDWQFEADLAGTITDPEGLAWDIDTDMRGDFVGEQAGYAAGEVEGSACGSLDCSYVYGGFIAAK